MSERKVINKYYPKDYDPSKLKRDRSKKGRPLQTKVRMALPMSVQCVSCGNFMARGSKFNARKETVIGEDYLGIKTLRFYFRCSKCFQELTIKTDPKISDYVAEHGIKANFILHKAAAEEEALEAEEKEKLELFDKMKLLEQKSIASLAETEINDAIDTVLMLQSRRAQLSTEELHNRALQSLSSANNIYEEEEELTEDELAELIEMENAMAQKHSKNLANFLLPSPFSQTSSTSASSPSSASSSHPLSSHPQISSSSLDSSSQNEEDDDDDPIAARSRLARQRIEAQRNSNWQESSNTQDVTLSTSKNVQNSNSNSIPSSASQTPSHPMTSTSEASKLMPPPKTSSLLKHGWSVKPVKESEEEATKQSSIVTISSSSSSQSSSTGSTSLIGKKYARRDDDE